MRLISSTDSASRDEISVIAIFECFFSIGLYISLCAYLNSLQPFFIAIILAPLLLFRTERSKSLTLSIYKKINYFYTRIFIRKSLVTGNYIFFKGLVALLLGFIFSISVALTGILCRIAITFWCLVRFPLDTMKAMPSNWKRQALCTDIAIPPEIIPGEDELRKEVITFRSFQETMRKTWEESGFLGFLVSIPYIPILLLGFIPAYLLRFSFKATSFIYAPFIWIAKATFNSSDSLKLRLQFITTSELEKVRRWYSGLIIAVFLYISSGIKFSSEIDKLVPLFNQIMPSLVFQYIFLIESVLTFALFYYADIVKIRMNENLLQSETKVAQYLSSISFFRAFLAFIAICGLFLISLNNVQFDYIIFHIFAESI